MTLIKIASPDSHAELTTALVLNLKQPTTAVIQVNYCEAQARVRQGLASARVGER